jgi:hypothetical protein
MKDKKGSKIMGRFFSEKELFWNGVAFLLIGVMYDVIIIAPQLPLNWKVDNSVSLGEIDRGWIIQTVFILISYIFIKARFLKGNIFDINEINAKIKYFFKDIILIFGLLFIDLILKILILLLFF